MRKTFPRLVLRVVLAEYHQLQRARWPCNKIAPPRQPPRVVHGLVAGAANGRSNLLAAEIARRFERYAPRALRLLDVGERDEVHSPRSCRVFLWQRGCKAEALEVGLDPQSVGRGRRHLIETQTLTHTNTHTGWDTCAPGIWKTPTKTAATAGLALKVIMMVAATLAARNNSNNNIRNMRW